MTTDPLEVRLPQVRRADSNSLLRLHDLARTRLAGPLPQDARRRAERALRLVGEELRARGVPT